MRAGFAEFVGMLIGFRGCLIGRLLQSVTFPCPPSAANGLDGSNCSLQLLRSCAVTGLQIEVQVTAAQRHAAINLGHINLLLKGWHFNCCAIGKVFDGGYASNLVKRKRTYLVLFYRWLCGCPTSGPLLHPPDPLPPEVQSPGPF